jgi:hypothetical protein
MSLGQHRIGLLIILAAAVSPLPASAGRLAVFGIGNQYDTATDATVSATHKAKLGLGGGLSFEIPLGPRLGLDIGAGYVQRKQELGGILVNSASYVQAPVLLRLWFSRNFSLALGGYYAKGIGTMKTDTAGVVTTAPLTTEQKSDYGGVGAVGLNFPLGSGTAFLVEGRYDYGFKDLDPTATKVTTREMQALVGFRFLTGR